VENYLESEILKLTWWDKSKKALLFLKKKKQKDFH